MVTGPERRGQSHGERRRSTEQADYLQGEDREGCHILTLLCSVSSDTLFPGYKHRSVLAQTSRGRPGPGTGKFPGVALMASHP